MCAFTTNLSISTNPTYNPSEIGDKNTYHIMKKGLISLNSRVWLNFTHTFLHLYLCYTLCEHDVQHKTIFNIHKGNVMCVPENIFCFTFSGSFFIIFFRCIRTFLCVFFCTILLSVHPFSANKKSHRPL